MATKTLYVGNLPYSTNETAITSAFSEFGARNARIIEGRGFGFVDVDEDQAQNAISAMNGKEMDGRSLTVNEARPKGESGGGGNRSNYSGGGRSGKRGW